MLWHELFQNFIVYYLPCITSLFVYVKNLRTAQLGPLLQAISWVVINCWQELQSSLDPTEAGPTSKLLEWLMASCCPQECWTESLNTC